MFPEFIAIVVYAICIGTMSSMVGRAGGSFNTPLLIIVFGLSAQLAPTASLFAALFMTLVSTRVFFKQNSNYVNIHVGLFLAICTIPGIFVGVLFRTLITNDYVLRLIFGITLIPVAIRMLFAKRMEADNPENLNFEFKIANLGRDRLVIALIGAFITGIAAGLLGLAGGVLLVPILCIVMQLPMLITAATSCFTMIFVTSSGTIVNYFVVSQSGELSVFLNYGITLGIGMMVGGIIGPRYACRVDAVQLKRLFGILLIFPLVMMMNLGQLWLDPNGVDFALATLGNIVISLLIIIPLGLIRFYQLQSEEKQDKLDPEECNPVLPD